MGLRADDRAEPGRRLEAEQGDRVALPQVQGAIQVRGRQGRSRPHTVQVGDEKVTAESIVVATGVRPRPLPGAEYDGKTIIGYKEAMSPPPAAEVDADHRRRSHRPRVRLLLQRDRHQGHARRVDGPHPPRRGRGGLRGPAQEPDEAWHGDPHEVEDRQGREDGRPGSRSTIETPDGPEDGRGRDDAGLHRRRWATSRGSSTRSSKVELVKNHIKADPKNGYQTTAPGIYAVGDVIGPPWLAHVAHHEAISCIERLCGFADHPVDYTNIPGCTYTDPGVASVGLTETRRPRGRPRGPHRPLPLLASAAGPWPPTRPRASSSSSSTPSTASCSAPTCWAPRPPS